MKHDPLYYAFFHRQCLVAINWLYFIGLISTHFYDNTHQMSMHAFLYWLFAWIALEVLLAWYRHNFMDGPFRDWRVALKLVYTRDVCEATGIAYDVAVWPACKIVKRHAEWAMYIRNHWINNISISFVLMFISILIA